MTPNRKTSFDDLPGEASQLLIRIGLGVLAIVVPCAAILSRRAIFILFPLGASIVLAGALIAPRRDAGQRVTAAFVSPAGLIALFLAAWSAASLLWTPFAPEGAERFLKIIGTAILAASAAAVLPAHTRVANLYLAPVGLAAASCGALALAIQTLIADPETQRLAASVAAADPDGSTLDRAIVVFVLMLWPALGALASRQRWATAGALTILVTITATMLWSPVALLALAAGALAFAASVSNARRVGAFLAVAFAVLFIAAPLLPWLARVLVGSKTANLQGLLAPMADWLAITKQDGVRLLTGHGLDSALRGIAAGYLPAGTPRSILFEVWYELGIVGALGAAALTWRAFLAAGEAAPGVAPFIIACLVSALTIASLGLNTAQIGWLTLIAVVAILSAAVVNGQYRNHRPAAQMAPSATAAAARRPG